MQQLMSGKFWILLFWSVLMVVSLTVRPLMPVDETRYASVAWEMWLRQDFLVPHLNGETYSHKPPLLFWLMQLSWWLFGVNEYSMRLIAPLFSLAALFLTGHIASLLWPERKRAEEGSRYVLLGFFFWMLSGTLTMFDMLLTFFVLLGIYCQLKLAWHGFTRRRWILFGIAIGGGVLSKGPVILLHLLPVALAAPWWWPEARLVRWHHWYLGILFAVCLGAAIALCWAIPAGISGGEAYRNAIFLGQTSGRLVKSFAHRLPWWWYLQMLSLLLLPWLLCKPFWKGMRQLSLREPAVRFCLAWLLPVLIAFSVISGKRLHYLLPLLPGFALLTFRGIDGTGSEALRARPLLLAIVYLLAGTALLLLPFLNDIWHWQQDLTTLSPIWGILLVFVAVYLFSAGMTETNYLFRICLSSVAALLLLQGAFFSIEAYRYDLTPPARKISALRAAGRDVTYYGAKYHGQYNFLGRLQKPLNTIQHQVDLLKWAVDHSSDYIIVRYRPPSLIHQQYEHFPFKSRYIALLPVKDILANPALLPY